MKRLTYLLFCLVLGIGLVSAQTTRVTGVVTSADDGEPIIGATVMAKGTNVGTVTDFDGNFELNVPSTATTLSVSYVGMVAQDVRIQPNVRVVLKSDTQNLEEIVVTAMGISREKKSLGYAVQDVKADELTKGANTSLSGALQGKVSGIQISPSSGMPGASSKITIRGSRSFTGNNTPLYVVDGMPISSTSDMDTGNSVTGSDYAGRAVDIDPNDIESINVLKGQAASALYGMRASNGVIVITTKSGKGQKAGKPQITITSNVSFDKPSTYFDYQTKYAQGTNSGGFNPNTSTSWGPLISELANDPNYGGNTDNQYTQQYGMKQGQYYVPQRAKAGLDPWATPQAYDNVKDFFDTGVTWSNNVNVTQAMEKGHYSFSLGNMTQDGVVPSTGMDRYNARMVAEAKLHENWKTGFSGSFVASTIKKATGANNGLVATIYGAPSSYDLGGIPSHIEGNPYSQNTYRATSGFDGPYWSVKNNKNEEKNQRFFGNVYANYTTKLNTENHKLDVKYQLGVDSYSAGYSDVWGYGHANNKGEINERNFTVLEANSLLTANYSWTINDDMNLGVTLINEIVQNKNKYVRAEGRDFNFPGWNHMANASSQYSYSTIKHERTVGNAFDVSFSYANMLYLNATGRQDVVSYMPRNNRTYFYPSASLGFIFTELEPLKNNILTYGKIRGSIAEVGMGERYYPSYYSKPTYGGGFYNGTPIIYPMNGISAYSQYAYVYDPNLKPQNTRSYELGADLTFFNGLFSINYTYSRQNTEDQIFDVPIAASTGSQSLITNGGKVHTNAHEMTLLVNPISTKNFNWDFSINFSKIDNYVDELADGVESIMLGGFVDPQVRLQKGDKYPILYGTTFLRNDNGDIVVDENGLPQFGPEGKIGDIAPDFNVGFNTSFQIFKLRLSATFDWKAGGQMYCGTYNTANFYGTTKHSQELRDGGDFFFERPAVKLNADGSYSPNNIPVRAPKEYRFNEQSDAYYYLDLMSSISEGGVYDNDYIKLREISASYPVWSKNGIDVNVSAFARNILVWTKLKGGLDPESSQGNNNMAGGFERFSLPGTSSYGFGVNVKF